LVDCNIRWWGICRTSWWIQWTTASNQWDVGPDGSYDKKNQGILIHYKE